MMAKKKHDEAELPHATELAPQPVAVEPVVPTAATFDLADTSALPSHMRESITLEVRDLFAKAEALLIVLEKRADPRFARARIKLGETVGALR